ncbi:hypothetical protein P691DRAFT_655183 [Macrolepiota fuliginosa MF-IS2]|uniref:RGS domain-containing protein n=1 Tax=Macrolepiota fuliginosa MF-IS2 TaxID=1400762 RepID=A0A9P5XPT9_9AGAR|nr:hypothetical protein P691DRAFT_655183 [Macrolepiota fuliginosa MF-IS2]
MSAVQTQPSTVRPSLWSLLTLPIRLCNPPPAVGKVRSFGVTPLFNVRLDDVLNRKHLPPLGLKDFEEWLLYVEMCSENLYFILWLREYHARYIGWQKQRNSPQDAVFASTAASRLATFYSRAKQTFFTPNAKYELNLPSSLLSPFQKPDQDIHPDPSLFRPIEEETRRMLEQSLRRFIQAQMNNVGNRRVLCGIIAGIFIILVGFLPPTITNFVGNEPRWLRLTAYPGMWLGLTILLSALHGVCLGVYIFGDLRQLRKFELARPVAPKTRNSESNPRFPLQHVALPAPPSAAYNRSHRHRQKRPGSPVSFSEFSDATLTTYSREPHTLLMAPGYFEMNPIEGPSTSPILLEYCNPENDAQWLRQQELQKEQERNMDPEPHSPDSFTSTATFIAPFCSPSTTDISGYWDSEEMQSMNARWYRLRAMEDLEKLGCEAVRRQPLAEFDFDGLPPAPIRRTGAMSVRSGTTEAPSDYAACYQEQETDVEQAKSGWDDEEPSRWQWLLDFVDRVQTRCSFKKWGSAPGTNTSGPVFLGGVPPYLSPSNSSRRKLRPHATPKSKSTLSVETSTTAGSNTERVKKRSRLMNAVPAFAVPLTKVLNPIIVRGQWEIVVRSAGFAFIISWVVCASLLAVPRR